MKYKKALFNTILLAGILFASVPQKVTTVSALSARKINAINTSTTEVRNYYSALNAKPESERKGEALLASLKPILKNGHESFNYKTVWDWTKVTDRDWDLSPMTTAQLNSYNFDDNPYVRLLYRSDNGTATASRHDATHGSVIDREHVWPKSLGNFGENAPAGTDLHHLILADSKNNQAGHSNYPYGNVNPNNYDPIATYMGDFTGKRGTITYQGKTFTVYEPQDEDKGDIARAMFYMVARYSSYTSSSDPYLKLTNDGSLINSRTSSTSNPGYGGLLNTLLEWHELDPVSDYEIRRNNLIYNNAQFNRNPFIDYPSWVNSIWGDQTPANPLSDDVREFGVSQSVAPTSLSVSPASISLYEGESETLSLNVAPLNANKSVTWSSAKPSVATVSSSGQVTALSVGTAIITATSTLDNSVKGTTSITVTTTPSINLTSISVSNYEQIVKFASAYDTTSMNITAYYSDESSKDIKDDAIIELPDTNQLGEQVLTISYKENNITKYTTYTVKVTNNGVVIGEVTRLATDLFISEYIEGSSNNKYLEIYNGTGQSVNLSGYKLRLFANGVSTPNNEVTLSGTLAHNNVVVYKHTSATLTLPSGVTALTNAAINYNGNDAIGLYKTSTNSYVDIFGIIGNNPGTAWTGGGVTTVDKTLVRKPSVYEGITINPSTFDPSIEWTEYPVDTTTYLGSHVMGATLVAISKESQANAWATYFLDSTSSYCEDLNGGALASSIWSSLGEEYAYMDETTKQLFVTTFPDGDVEGVAGAKARYQFLVSKYSLLKANNFLTDENNNPIFSFYNLRSPHNDQNKETFVLIIVGSLIILGFLVLTIKRRSLNTN